VARSTGRNPGRPPGGRDVLPTAAAPGPVQVVLHPLRRRDRDLLLLIRPATPRSAAWPGPGRTRTRRADNGPRSGPGPPTSSQRPGCPAASPGVSSPPPAPRHAAASWAASAPAGHPSSAALTSSRYPVTPPAPLRAAAPADPATMASSAAICRACAAICCACSRISASRRSAGGSPSGGASVTARNHPGNHAQPPRQQCARRPGPHGVHGNGELAGVRAGARRGGA